MSNLYKLAIVGCGNIASFADFDSKKRHIFSHAKAISKIDRIQISACCDLDDKTLAEFAKEWKVNKKYRSLETMLSEEKIDILVIATPTSQHYDNLKTAFLSDVRVIFCEKPLTYDLQSGIEIVKMAQNLNKLLLVNYMRRWDKFYLECKDILDNFELGRLETMVVYADTALYMNSSHMLDLIVYFGGDVFSLVGYIDKINKPRVVNGKKDFGATALITHKNGVFSFLKATAESQKNHYYEIDFQCSKGRLRILNDDIKYEVYKFKESQQHKGLDELFLEYSKFNDDLDERVINAYMEIINYLDHNKSPSYTAADSLNSLELIELISKSDLKKNTPVFSKL